MTGVPILDPGEFGYHVPNDAIDPEQAIMAAVRVYLEGLEFSINGRIGPVLAPPTPFRLAEVLDEWPEPGHAPRYPAVSLSLPTAPVLAHKLGGPSALEDTWGLFDCEDKGIKQTVLWKLGELDTELQIDLWASDVPMREALLARVLTALVPGEATSRLLLTGTPFYWSRPVRVQLLGYRRIDENEAVYANERRAIVTANVSMDVVDLRCATALDPRVQLTQLGPTVEITDPEECPESEG